MFTIEDYSIILFPSTEDEEHWICVRFPEIPEIITGGSNIEEAILNAKEAFICHVEALQKQGKKIPVPSKKQLFDIKKEPNNQMELTTNTPF